MNNLKDMVMKSFEKIEKEGFIEKTIEEKLKDTMKSIIDSTFNSWSPFGKSLKEQVEKSVGVDLSALKIPMYNKMIGSMIKTQLEGILQKDGTDKIKEQLDDLLIGEEDDIKLSEIIEIFIEDNKEEAQEESWDEISYYYEHDDDFDRIYFDKEEGNTKYSCRNNIMLYKGKIFSMKLEDSKMRIEKDTIEFKTIGNIYGLEKKLFNLYARGSKIIIDDNYVDTNYCYDD